MEPCNKRIHLLFQLSFWRDEKGKTENSDRTGKGIENINLRSNDFAERHSRGFFRNYGNRIDESYVGI